VCVELVHGCCDVAAAEATWQLFSLYLPIRCLTALSYDDVDREQGTALPFAPSE
jgi:hypothetical protein